MRQNAITGALKKTGVLAALILLLLVPVARADPGFTLEGVKTWHWVDDTYADSVTCGDVDGDGQAEIVTGGWYNDGTRDRAQLAVWRWGPSHPTTVTLEAIADSYVNSLSPDSNYGSETSIKIDITTGATKDYNYTYVMFDLSSIPSDAVISSANLSLYMTGLYASAPFPPGPRIKVHYCSDTSWTELGITWNNKPPFDPEATSYRTFIGGYYPQYYNWNVTSDVSHALSNGKLTEVVKWPDYTLEASYGMARFQSREAANNPKLVVEYITYSLTLEAVVDWYWTSNTRIKSVACGDVDGDGQTEIVTGGYYDDGTRYWAQLAVWDGTTLTLEGVTTWYWVHDTRIYSVACCDVDGDEDIEIVTGGYYYDGTRYLAQLAVWDGATLTLEGVRTWYWVDDTLISSVAVGDVDGDGQVEIVTGGYYQYEWAQLVVWDGSTLNLEGVKSWRWGLYNTIESLAIGDVDGDGSLEIVTSGFYYVGGTRECAQLAVWDGSSLALEGVEAWYWVDYTRVFSVAVGDVDGDGQTEIVTGGWYYDDEWRCHAQLAIWDGATLALEDVTTWYWVGNTRIYSVACSDVDGDPAVEIVTGGDYNDGTRDVAQLCVWGFT